MDLPSSQFPMGDDLFLFSLDSEDLNLSSASLVPVGCSLVDTPVDMDPCSYATTNRYNALTPEVLPLSQPSVSPSPFASSASASPAAVCPAKFRIFPNGPFKKLNPEAASAVSSAKTLPTVEAVRAAANAAAAATIAQLRTKSAATYTSLPTPSTAVSSTPSPTKVAYKTRNNSSSSSGSGGSKATADGNKPCRKRPKRYVGVSEEVMQRRRDQNRHSQRAYRERKDQKIKDLEADVVAKDRVISQLRGQLRSQKCFSCGGGGPGFPPGPPPLYCPTMAAAAAPRAPAPLPQQQAPSSLPTFAPGPGAFQYQYPPAYMPYTQAGLLPLASPMDMVSPVAMGQAFPSSTAVYEFPAEAGTPPPLPSVE